MSVLALVSCASTWLMPQSALAEFVDPTLWVTDAPVRALAVAGDTLYAGGEFNYVGPNTGGFGAIGATTGSLCAAWPRVEGTVLTIAPDAAGGWYVGGTFQSVAGVPRANLAHIRRDGTLDGWNPSANATVYRIALSGSTVYVGGLFTSVGGSIRTYLAALDATSGLATAWNPAPNATVYDIVQAGSTLYVGGSFTSIGGQPRGCIAALDASTGLASAWNPGGNYSVNVIVIGDSTLYVAGGFTNIGGSVRNGLAALDVHTGLATTWAPTPGGVVFALALSGSTVYAGGTAFSNLRYPRRGNLAAYDATSGLITSWDPSPDSAYAVGNYPNFDLVNAIVVSGSRVYAAGVFGNMGRRNRSNIAALDVSSGFAIDWNPGANGSVCALAVAGDSVYAGGHFSSVCGLSRTHLAAFDLTTGAATSWHPAGTTNTIASLAATGSRVYFGISGASGADAGRGPVSAVNAATGLEESWNPGGDNGALALAANDSVIFVGGSFHDIGGQLHQHFAALSPLTGLLNPGSPDANGQVNALAGNGTSLVVGGSFTQFGGQSRANIAALDLATSLPANWSPSADGAVNALAVQGSTVYAGGNFSTIGGQLRVGIAALDLSTGLATSWNPGPAGTQLGVAAILPTASSIYVGGSFTTMGGQPRKYLASLDPTTGHATSWDPRADSWVNALVAAGPAMIAGGYMQTLGGRSLFGLARVLPSPTSPPQVHVLSPNGGEWVSFGSRTHVTWDAVATAPGVESVDLYLSRTGPAGPWQLIAAGAPNSGDYAWSVVDTTSSSNCYLRADARDYAGNLASDFSDAAFTIGSGTLAVDPPARVEAFALHPVTPNPVRGAAQVSFALATSGTVRLSVIDVQGRVVQTLVDGSKSAGRYTLGIDARGLRSGLYFARLRSGGTDRSQRFVVVN